HFETKQVVVNAKPGIPKVKVRAAALSAKEMNTLSGKALLPGGTPDLSGVFSFLWGHAYRTVATVVGKYLREHPDKAQAVAAWDGQVIDEIIERIRNNVLTPAEESRLEAEFLRQAGLKG